MLQSDYINPRTTAGARPTIALVGNAPLQYDQSKQIDSCDIVVRCNEAKNLGLNSGNRTDIICVCNAGSTGLRFVNKQSLRYPRFPELKQIWFAHGGNENIDLSLKILAANNLAEMEIIYLSGTMSRSADELLRHYGADAESTASTGFLALWHILERQDFSHYDKLLFGFTFHVWEGHPAFAERKAIEDLCRSRNDLFFIPATSMWPLKSRFRDTGVYKSGRKIVFRILNSTGRFLRHMKLMD